MRSKHKAELPSAVAKATDSAPCSCRQHRMQLRCVCVCVCACKGECMHAHSRQPELLFHAGGGDATLCGQAHLALELGKGITTTQGMPRVVLQEHTHALEHCVGVTLILRSWSDPNLAAFQHATCAVLTGRKLHGQVCRDVHSQVKHCRLQSWVRPLHG